MLALWSMEMNRQKQIKVKGKRREEPHGLSTNQVEQCYCQHLGHEKGKTYPISTATKAAVKILPWYFNSWM